MKRRVPRGRSADAKAASAAPRHRPQSLRAAHGHDPARLELPDSLESRLSAGHPWIYRDHVPAGFRAQHGDFVHFRSGRFDGFALWDAESPIALRVFSRSARPDAAWIRDRVEEAWQLRQRMLPTDTDAFRLLFGEGDGLPGVVVDVYAGHAVVVAYSSALAQVLDWVVAALSARPEIRGVSERSTRRKERSSELRHRAGAPAPPLVMVQEHGLRYEVDLAAGQKTGLFLDHRANRHFLRERARGLRVLNLFSYTGAFSVSCMAGGARHVTSVDIAGPAIAAAERNVAHNGFAAELHRGVAGDVFEFLERARHEGERWDLVIADPPSFASSRAELFAALRAYKKLHSAALSVLTAGGLYAAASCTSQVSPDAFRQTIAEAGGRRHRLTVLHEAAHDADHPYGVGHLEGRYLKFVLCRSLPPA